MKPIYSVVLMAAALAAAGSLAGCGGGNASETSAPPAPSAPMAAKSAAAPAGGSTATSMTQPAGPFNVSLSFAPKAGIQPFTASVTKDGKPLKNAAVVLTLSMPSMGMSNPSVNLKPSGDHYSGTANIGMSGDWNAKVTVKAAGTSGAAKYTFKAVE